MVISEHSTEGRIAWVMAAFFMLVCALAVVAALPDGNSVRYVFATVCHQDPSRCHRLAGRPFGLCVRCWWIYLGLAVGHPGFAGFRVPEKWAIRFVAGAAGLLLADVALEMLGAYDNLKGTRAVTGFLFGVACSWFILRGLTEWLGTQKTNKIDYESN